MCIKTTSREKARGINVFLILLKLIFKISTLFFKMEDIQASMSKISLFKNQNNTNIKIFYIRE